MVVGTETRSLGTVLPSHLTSLSTLFASPLPCQGPGPLSPYSHPPPHGPSPVSSFSSHLHPFFSPPPPHPHPSSLGDKRARLERVPRSFIPHHMGPKAKSSAKRLNQVCRTKCYELTLWVYNFMPFVAICLSKQPPFHTDIQTHTFPSYPPFSRLPTQPGPEVRDKKTCPQKSKNGGI